MTMAASYSSFCPSKFSSQEWKATAVRRRLSSIAISRNHLCLASANVGVTEMRKLCVSFLCVSLQSLARPTTTACSPVPEITFTLLSLSLSPHFPDPCSLRSLHSIMPTFRRCHSPVTIHQKKNKFSFRFFFLSLSIFCGFSPAFVWTNHARSWTIKYTRNNAIIDPNK